MLYKISTIIAIVGCLVLLAAIVLEQFKGSTVPYLKPILWMTIAALLVRVGIRIKKK